MIPSGFHNTTRFINVVLEGVDCSGKTAIAKALVKMSPTFDKIVHFSNPKDLEDGQVQYMAMAARLNSETKLVLDRAQIGERVYAPKYRGYYPLYMNELDETIPKETLFVLVVADVKEIERRFDGKFIDKEDIDELQKTFFAEFSDSPLKSKMVLDTTHITPEQAAWWLMCMCGAKAYS